MRTRDVLRVLLGLVAVAALGWFVWHADLPGVGRALVGLGGAAPVLLGPYLLVYLSDTLGWLFSFRQPLSLGFLNVLRIRWAGEAVNNVVPSAYLGGEAVKIYLLARRGVPPARSAPAAVVSKTVQTLGQVCCIALGGLAFVYLGVAPPIFQTAMLAVLITGGLAIAGLFWIQRRGMFGFLLGVLRRLRWHPDWVERRQKDWRMFDHEVGTFYVTQRGRFLGAFVGYLGGWLLDALEIYLAAYLLNVSMNLPQAIGIETFVSVAKAMSIFIPAAVGVQDFSVVFLCRMAGVPDSFGFTYAVLRRAREVIFVLLGWVWLMLEGTAIKGLARRVRIAGSQ